LSERETDAICRRMAEVLEESANLRPRTALHDRLILQHSLPRHSQGDIHTFSGGVGDCVYGREGGDVSFHDIGKRLGLHIRESRFFTQAHTTHARETQHATVIGAGAYSMSLSGSTICYANMVFPVKNLQVGKIRFRGAEDIALLSERIREQRRILDNECAVGFEGISNPSYQQIEEAADCIAAAMDDMPVRILICVEDMAKALGQALIRHWGRNTSMLCLDGVSLAYGDMVSIGAPLSEGRVVPVVVKTLAFSSEITGE
ncbi:MAG: ethanolamine ammonia-lyase reactivating factor EutA, partial [Clostridia bacterium]|nr:ethanolamine ammonia-lyase reactivating factor EutA [Clostridia bacterium]